MHQKKRHPEYDAYINLYMSEANAKVQTQNHSFPGSETFSTNQFLPT